MENKYELLISIVNRGQSDAVVNASKQAGARGGTIIYGRGTGIHEKDSILGVSLQPEKELILTLTSSENKNNIMENICKKAKIDQPGVGICFTLPVTDVRGITSKTENSENK